MKRRVITNEKQNTMILARLLLHLYKDRVLPDKAMTVLEEMSDVGYVTIREDEIETEEDK